MEAMPVALTESMQKGHEEASSSHRVPTPLGGQELGGTIRQLDRGTLAFRAQLQQKQAAGEALHAPGQHALKGPVEQLLLEAVEREDWGGPVGRDQANAVLMLGLQQGQHALETRKALEEGVLTGPLLAPAVPRSARRGRDSRSSPAVGTSTCGSR